MTDNKKIAEQVLRAVGGAANLKDATHCMTRLRLYLKDDSVPKDDEVKKISGVLGVVRGGQQYQIIIGTNVPKVYDELCKLAGISATFYHAGLEHSTRDERQTMWQEDKVKVMVATNAFGMGIDKPDVRVVIHIDSPDSIAGG